MSSAPSIALSQNPIHSKSRPSHIDIARGSKRSGWVKIGSGWSMVPMDRSLTRIQPILKTSQASSTCTQCKSDRFDPHPMRDNPFNLTQPIFKVVFWVRAMVRAFEQGTKELIEILRDGGCGGGWRQIIHKISVDVTLWQEICRNDMLYWTIAATNLSIMANKRNLNVTKNKENKKWGTTFIEGIMELWKTKEDIQVRNEKCSEIAEQT